MQETSLLTILKNLAYIPAFLLVGISPESISILGVFMFLDTILGVTRVYVNHGGRAIRSYKLTAGIIAKLCVLLVPILTVWAGRGVGVDLIDIATWTIGALILAQFYSIVSNIYSIHLRHDVDEFDAVSWVLHRVQSAVERALKDTKPVLKSALKDDEKKD